jgi:hypothetical protein
MSKIRLAEYHYRKAVEIHPSNAVLLGCVGMVCHLFDMNFLTLMHPCCGYRLLRLSNVGETR